MAGQQSTQTLAAKFDVTTLGGVLSKLDASLTTDKLAGLLKGAGADETRAVQNVFRQLGKILLGQDSNVSESELPALLKNFDAAIAGGASGNIVVLSGLASDKLVGMANDDIGVRYALMNGLPFAISGSPSLYDNLNRDGSLFRFDPNTGERTYTDEWLKDRAQFMSLKAGAGGDGNIAVSGSQSWVFEERNADGATRINANADQAQRAPNKMIFATATTDTQNIVGGSGADHVYSGGGDDLINAGAGDDYVEAGAGDDMLDGGRGNDQLLGGEGNDQLDGGIGDDKLFGGSGADYLVGGQGNDRLDGGDGFDSYVIDGNEGNDVIIDGDGKGEIIYNGVALTGAEHAREGKYTPAVGQVSYTFAGDPDEGGVLTINTQGGSVKVVNFKNGNLGLSFGDGLQNGSLNSSELGPVAGANLYNSDTPRTGAAYGASAANATPDRLEAGGLDSNVAMQRLPSAKATVTDAGVVAALFEGASNYSEKSPVTTNVEGSKFDGLFSDRMDEVPLLTGENVTQAISMKYNMDSRAIEVQSGRGRAVTTSFVPVLAGEVEYGGISLRHLEYALMDFHDAINIGAGVGGDNLGDATSLSVGALSIGASFDRSQLSDDKYTDLGSKAIGVKG